MDSQKTRPHFLGIIQRVDTNAVALACAPDTHISCAIEHVNPLVEGLDRLAPLQ